MYVEEGETNGGVLNSAQSYIYDKIVFIHSMAGFYDLDRVTWPEQIHEMRTRIYCETYQEFIDSEAYDKYPDPVKIPETALDEKTVISRDDVPYRYYEYFGEPDQCGVIIEVDISELRRNPGIHKALISFMEEDEFPLKKEFLAVKKYYSELEAAVKKEQKSKRLFDD